MPKFAPNIILHPKEGESVLYLSLITLRYKISELKTIMTYLNYLKCYGKKHVYRNFEC